MKIFLAICALCVLAVSAVPDDLIKLSEINVADTATPAPAAAAPAPPKKGTVADRTRLLANLFNEYNKKVIPDDVKLNFGVSLIDFHVCDERSLMESSVFLKYDWEDSRLAWDPEEYGGTDVIRIPSGEVWKPDFTLYNSADYVNMVHCWDSNVLMYSSGKLLWVPPCKMTSKCSFSLKKHPYGEQTCSFKFGSWTYDGLTMDVQFYENKTAVGIDDIINTSGFDVVSTTAERHERYYPCCKEPYLDLTFNVTVKRTPGEELFKKM